jgi:secondary thiamine-phosphate synthase enzyme
MASDITLSTGSHTQLINITSQVGDMVRASKVREGTCTVYVPHTTAGVMINEAADPSVGSDVLMELNKIVPFNDNYRHMEGNSAAHIKSILVGSSCQIPVEGGRLALGTWQGIFFCEFDGPRQRRVKVSLIGA